MNEKSPQLVEIEECCLVQDWFMHLKISDEQIVLAI